MQAAVDAAKAEIAAQEPEQDPDTEPMPRVVTSGQANSRTSTAAAQNGELNRDRADKPSAKRTKTAVPRRDRQVHRRKRAEPVQHSTSPETAAAANGTPRAASDRATATSAPAGQSWIAAEPTAPVAATAAPAASAQPVAPPRPAVRPSPPDLPKRIRPAARTAPTEPTAVRTTAPQVVEPSARLAAALSPAPPKPETKPRGAEVKDKPAVPDVPATRVRPQPGPVRERPRRVQPQPNARPSSRRTRRTTTRIYVGAAVVMLIAAAALTLLSRSAPPSSAHGLAAQQRAELANDSAAAWVVQQVSPSAVVACDPQMCRALAVRGFPSSSTQPLGRTSPIPTDSTLVIDTAAVRGLYGTSLAADYAPFVLTTIGSGPTQITIRVMAPQGAAKYQQQLASDRALWKQNGQALAGSSRVKTTASAHAQMTNGQVDPRLVLAITAAVIKVPVDIVDFGNVATHGNRELPLRYVDLAEDVPAANLSPSAYVKTVIAALNSSNNPYRYLRIQRLTIAGTSVLRIQYGAPSPLVG